ncbi:MAG: OmpH family outer membrane protein [Candidatus Midichloria sp.]|nr:OmpH family outer membrane protein [Candidatus Midichloria sp.]
MKKLTLIISMLLLSSLAISARAEIKIAVVDGQKIIESSLAYKDITGQVEKKATLFKNSAAKMQENLQKKYKEIESQKLVLSSEAYGKKTKEFELEAEKAQESAYMDRMSLDKAYSEAMKVLEKKITDIIQAKAIEKKLDMVMTKINMIYNNKELEITDSIIEELNKSLPAVAVKFDAIPAKSDKGIKK